VHFTWRNKTDATASKVESSDAKGTYPSEKSSRGLARLSNVETPVILPLGEITVISAQTILSIQAKIQPKLLSMGHRVLIWSIGWAGLVLGLNLGLASCNRTTPNAANSPEGRGGPTPVDVAIARTGFLTESQVYMGTTRPQQEVILRSQVEGRLLDLNVDVGDRVVRGQRLASLDDAILRAAVLEAEAEQAARQAEISQAQTQVNRARAEVEQARLTLQQKRADAARLTRLNRSGAISLQEAEQARTEANTAAQALAATQSQVRDAQQAVTAAQGRLRAQVALVAQARERLSYGIVTSPLSGVVLERLTETGNLLQPGGQLLSLGDLSQMKVVVDLAEVALARVRVGQMATVRLDALPDQTFTGRVRRISPLASNTARLVPVEISLANPRGQIGSGMLARVEFQSPSSSTVVIPLAALNGGATGESRGGGRPGGERRSGNRRSGGNRDGDNRSAESPTPAESPTQRPQADSSPSASPSAEESRPDTRQPRADRPDSRESGEERPRGRRRPRGERPDRSETSASPEDASQSTVFVVTGSRRRFKVEARPVRLGRQGNGRVEIRSGLLPGERYVVRAGRPLRDGAPVRLSILSEGRGGSRGGNRSRPRDDSRPEDRSGSRPEGRSERP
jgi:HlyD family secretion protein